MGNKVQYLFECTLGIEQVVDHVSRHADEGGHTNAVAQDGGPWRIMVVEQLDIRRKGQETDDDELDINKSGVVVVKNQILGQTGSAAIGSGSNYCIFRS